MEFSVIVPTFQEEGFIEECLRSIKQQNYNKTAFEIIVSDASSTDRTAEIARQYTDNVLVEDKRGIAYGRNAGSHSAHGDIFVFVDADATLSPDFLYHCHNLFMDPSLVGMTGIARPKDGGILQRLVYRGTYLLVRLFHLFGLSLFPGVCVAYKREAFNKIGGFREDFGIVEDLDLSNRISDLGACLINAKAVAYVSTRRLERHLFSTVLFHIYCDIKYLCTGKAPAAVYAKSEELNSRTALWKQLHRTIK
jgi:cellulose synthase/poly-beta-1,6-N-acetylglucosamine synthase-like glycosyltransferase